MKKKEKLINHGLMRFLLFALVLLMSVGTWAQTSYGLFIGDYEGYGPDAQAIGVSVNSTNASNIKDQCIKGGTVSFNNESRTLTLTNATIDGTIYSYGDLTIVLIGENYITAVDSSAIQNDLFQSSYNLESLTIKGTGSLLAKGTTAYVTDGFNNPTFQDGQSLLLWAGYDADRIHTALYGTQLFSGGNGSLDTPYLISSTADLKNLSLYYNAEMITDSNNFQLTTSLDCTNLSGFVPIGSSSVPFIGTFDGKNNVISHLACEPTGFNSAVGFFGIVGSDAAGATINNLILQDCTISGYANSCGAIAGSVITGRLTNCKVKGSTTVSCQGANGALAGAIVGNYDDGAALTGNYYDYTVTTSTKVGADDAVIKERYEQRGTGFDIDIFTDDGAVMYTKLVTLPDEIAEGCSVEGGEERYYRENADYGTEMYIAPGEDASLTVIAAQGYYPESVKVTYGTTTIDATFDNQGDNYYYYSFKMPDENATVSVTVANGDSYPLFIGNTQVTSANKDDVLDDGGTVKFTSVIGQNQEPVYTLTLNNAAITAPVKVGLDNLTIDIQGTNTITTTATCLQAMDNTTPMLTFKSTGDVVGNLMITKTSGEVICNINNVMVSKELAAVIPNSGSPGGYTSNMYNFTDAISWARFVPSYGVTVDEIQIYADNYTDVLGDGKVSFDKTSHTLTLTDASISRVATYLSELDIDVIGNNSIINGANGPVFQNLDSQQNVLVKVLSSAAEKGCLSLYLNYNDKANSGGSSGFLDTNVTLQAEEPLEIFGDLSATYQAYVMIGEDIGCDLYVDNIKLVTGNVSNITNNTNIEGEPEASFDATTNTLTLNRVTRSYMMSNVDNILVQSNIENLTIKLVGNNGLYLGNNMYAVQYIGKSPAITPKLTFVSEVKDGQYGSLTITGLTSTDNIADYITNGYSIANTLTNQSSASGLIYTIGSGYMGANTLKIWSQETYGIVVTKGDVSYLINSANSDNVLRDNPTAPSVLFDGYNRLVLNNADLTSIVVNAVNSLPAKGLDIYLEGNSKITNPAGYAISYEGADAVRGLTFHTGCDAPGTLVCTNSTPVTFTPFGGFNQSYFNNLAQFIDDNKVTVKIPLGLIVDASTTVTSLIYDSNPAGRDDLPLDNVAFENVLYTLADDGTQGSEDGFDQTASLVVVNSLMTDELVRAIDTKQCVPSSDEYQRRFKGLTFVVPAGTGTIKLKLMTEYPGSYAFHVMVDYQDPVEIIPTATLAEYTVNYACSDVSYVKVYLVALDAPTPAPAQHRAGPKATISGGIGGMTVSSSLVTSAPNAGLQYRVMGVDDFMQRGNHIDVDATDVTDLPDNAFGFGGSPAPAMGSNRVAPSGHITYIDVSKTSITGKDFSRTEGAFVGVPEETLIFLPAGNTAVGKNFIIGGVCDNMAPLNAASEKEFEVATDFIAAKAEFNRVFTQSTSNDECYTVFLPYGVTLNDAVGEFFTYGGFDGATVTLNKVVALSDNGGMTTPNTPYIFKPAKEGALEAMMNAAVKKLPDTYVAAEPIDEMEAEGLHGVYEYYKWNTKPSNVYCYSAYEKNGIKAGEFAKVGEGTHIKPFRAYLRINATSAPESLSINWGDGTTSIIPLDKNQVQQDADGWYTISGFRLPSKPTEKGLYVNGGKKVVVK